MCDEPRYDELPPRTDCPGCGRVMSVREREQGLCDDCAENRARAMRAWVAYCARYNLDACKR